MKLSWKATKFFIWLQKGWVVLTEQECHSCCKTPSFCYNRDPRKPDQLAILKFFWVFIHNNVNISITISFWTLCCNTTTPIHSEFDAKKAMRAAIQPSQTEQTKSALEKRNAEDWFLQQKITSSVTQQYTVMVGMLSAYCRRKVISFWLLTIASSSKMTKREPTQMASKEHGVFQSACYSEVVQERKRMTVSSLKIASRKFISKRSRSFSCIS